VNRFAKKMIGAAALLVLTLFAVTCEEDEGIPTGSLARPDMIKKISGDSQTGAQNSQLAQPFTVQVLDSDNNPVPSHKVSFEVTSGGGAMAGTGEKTQETVTNSSGITTAYMVLGTDSINTVSATSVGATGSPLSGSPLVFNAFALPSGVIPDDTTNGNGGTTPPDTTTEVVPEADSIYIVSGDLQNGEVNTIMPLPLVTAVLDKDGQPMAGAQVTFTVKQGFCLIGPEGSDPTFEGNLSVTTNEDGLAVVTLKLGPGPDLDNTVVAEIRRPDGTVVSVSFSAQAMSLPDTANRLLLLSGEDQGYNGEYAVAALVGLPVVFKVVDTLRTGVDGDPQGAPIPNFPVLITAYSPSADGIVNDTPEQEPTGTGRLEALTDEDGLAAVRWTLGTETGGLDSLEILRNNNTLIAVAVFADGSQDTVIVNATGLPQAPASIRAAGGTQYTHIAGTAITGLGVFITDQFGNYVKNVGVSYGISVTPGGGRIDQPGRITDINGYTNVTIDQLATKVGDMTINASSGEFEGEVNFRIEILPDDPVEMLASDGDGQSSEEGTAFTAPLQVLIFDQYRNGVPDVLVSFQLTIGSASLSPNMVLTDSDGAAECTVTPLVAGNITVTASATISGVLTTKTFNLVATPPEE